MKNHLACTDLACVRGGQLLFERLSLTLHAGDAALVTGPNGAGKSSLLRIMAGLLAPAFGTVTHTGGIALANDAHALDPRRTLTQALNFWARIDRRPATAVTSALETMGIANLAQVPVRMLSTGQAKRATLARVIASNAGVWLLDEPGNGLDTASLDRLAHAMATHRASGGIVVAATHQPLGLADARTIAIPA